MNIHELQTPALLIEADVLDKNLKTMAEALPGARLRPHVKAHKCTSLARRQSQHGHLHFTCATIREAEGMAKAGLGEDLLLANEVVDSRRLADLEARVTVAVDSEATIDAAATGGIKEVLIDVGVGAPRCGCPPEKAGRLADLARSKGLEVRGVMGYEGHAVLVEDRSNRETLTAEAMQLLLKAHEEVGGEVISAGGTGTFDINTWATEIQAGSYTLMDTAYARLGLPFEQALTILATVISASEAHAVGNAGLKAMGLDHGNPEMVGDHQVWFVSDEHVTFAPASPVKVGDLVRVIPSHIDPTVAYHERAYLIRDDEILDTWEIDLRGW